MCTTPNVQPISDLSTYVLINNINVFKDEDDDIVNLSLTLDELFAGYLESDACELDEMHKSDRFRDYLRIKRLLEIIK